MKIFSLTLPLLVALLLIVGCRGDQQQAEVDSIDQGAYAMLGDGEFVDSTAIRGVGEAFIVVAGGPAGVVSRADAVVVAEIIEVVEVTAQERPAPPNWPADVITDTPVTTYAARVDQWVKGDGDEQILITQFGGVGPSGPVFTDGDFLLQPGRRYVVALTDREKLESVPGPGEYVKTGLGFGAFEVTDGVVHVLKNPLTEEVREELGGMSLREFVDRLGGWVANPPPSPTPAPPSEPEYLGPRNSFVIDTVAIDTRPSDNTATSLGSREGCGTAARGGNLMIDITADAVAALGDGEGGVKSFQFTLTYDPKVVKVVGSDHAKLLAVNEGSSLVSFGDVTPDADGAFVVAVADFGAATSPESGAGVLARLTLEAVGSGMSELALNDVLIVDDSYLPYTIGEMPAAKVAVDALCS